MRTRAGFVLAGIMVLAAACGGPTAAPRTDVPEPEPAPPPAAPPAGAVLPLPGKPEGLAVTATGLAAIGVREPDGVTLLDLSSRKQSRRILLPGAPRHLQLAHPQGPLLVPAENADLLIQIGLPRGQVIAATPVGDQPHDATAASGGIYVTDEYANTLSVIRSGHPTAVVPTPSQPGGVAASADGQVVVVVGVRGRQVEAYAPDGRSLGTAAAGVGPTHVRAGHDHLFYVADTQGNAVLVFEAGVNGIRQVGEASTAGHGPYGLAVDLVRDRLYVTLTATNQLQSFRISGQELIPERIYPSVRQPNDVAVNASTGQLVVAGTADSVLQLIDPAP